MENTYPVFDDTNPADVVISVDSFDDPIEDSIETPEEVQETPEESVEVETPAEPDPLAQATYESLVERGLLEQDEAFDGSFNYIDEKLDTLPNKLLKSAIDDLPDYSQKVLKFIATAGNNLTPEELDSYLREYLGEQVVPDVSTVDSARSVLEDHLRSQGLRQSAIQAQLDELEDSDELISEAEKLIKGKETKTDTLIKSKEADNQRIAQEQKEFVSSVNTTLSELGWSKQQQSKVLQTIPKSNDILNQVVKSPKAYIQLIDILSKFDGKEFNLADIEKRGESRVTASIKEKLDKSGFVSGSKTKASVGQPADDIFKDFKPVV